MTTCPHCASSTKKFGRTKDGRQRFRCLSCRKVTAEEREKPLGDMRLPLDRALLCLNLLCEGSSVRAIERITGTEKKTILRLLVQVGQGCERMLAETVKAVPVQDVQADELWTYICCKQGIREKKKITDPDAGDAYCYIGLERTSKLILAWHLGRRNGWDAHDFIAKLGTHDRDVPAHHGWIQRLPQRRRIQPRRQDQLRPSGRRYAPPRLKGQEKIVISGNPDEDRASTSHVERANWTLRGHLRRFTRLSNGFSRKKANLRAALALFFAYYNFCRMHKTIRMTPTMAAGIARQPWTLADLLKAAAC